MRPETIKLLEESISSNLFDLDPSNIFLDVSLQKRETKIKHTKIRSFLHSEGNEQNEKTPVNGRRYYK